MDWSTIRTVLLDMDGTLLDLHYDNYFWLEHVPRRYAEYHGVELEGARAQLYERFARHSGTLNWYCTDFWSSELALDIVQLKQEVAHLIAVRPDVPAFLNAARQADRRVVLVTNAHPDSLNLKMRETGLEPYFDALVSSHQVGLPKEHPDFWTGCKTSKRSMCGIPCLSMTACPCYAARSVTASHNCSRCAIQIQSSPTRIVGSLSGLAVLRK